MVFFHSDALIRSLVSFAPADVRDPMVALAPSERLYPQNDRYPFGTQSTPWGYGAVCCIHPDKWPTVDGPSSSLVG